MRIIFSLPKLNYELVSVKMKNLTEQITRAFGRVPTSSSVRKVRFNETVAGVLIENKYLVDSSVTPFVSLDWSSWLTVR